MDKVKLVDPKEVKNTIFNAALRGRIRTLMDIGKCVDSTPTTTIILPRRAIWRPIDSDDPVMATRFQCSYCACEISNEWDYEPPDDMWNYCLCCGSKMYGGE